MLQKFFRQLIFASAWPQGAIKVPKHQVHRGLHINGLPENTLAAFRSAADQGAKMCECDVRLSGDQIPVIFHDDDLKRLGGSSEDVRNLTAIELYEKAQVPTLEQMLTDQSLVPFFNIELKSKIADDPLPRKVAQVVKRVGAERRILFSSFNPAALFLMQGHLPIVPRALLVSPEQTQDNKWYLRHMALAPLLNLQMLNLEKSLVTEKSMIFWNSRQMPISVWTVNEVSEIQRYLDLGVASVISDLWPIPKL